MKKGVHTEVMVLRCMIKSDVINNVFYSSAQEIRKDSQVLIQRINQQPEQTIDRLCVQL